MKIIVAGSRSFNNYELVKDYLKNTVTPNDVIISGGAKGADSLGEQYAEEYGIPVEIFKADWKDISVPRAIIKVNHYGKYNAAAGFMRNERMAEVADQLVAFWDGNSPGTAHMVNLMMKLNKPVTVINPDNN